MKTISISTSPEHYYNHAKGTAFHGLFQETPDYDDPSASSTGGVCFLYIKNLSPIDIIFEGFEIRLGGTGQNEIIEVVSNEDATPIGGNTLTPANMNLSSGIIANGTFLSSGNISGMTKGTILNRYYIESSHTTQLFNFEQNIIIPTNKTVTFWAEYGGNELDGTLIFYFHDANE